MKKKLILVVDSDRFYRDLLYRCLRSVKFQVIAVDSGEEALEVVKSNLIDLLIINATLPGMDGLSVVNRLKGSLNTMHIPVVVLSNSYKENDIITFLDSGAADFITKPFNPVVLNARVRAIFRGQSFRQQKNSAMIQYDELYIDLRKNNIRVAGRQIHLTATEFKLLEFLISKPGWVFNRLEIAESINGEGGAVTSVGMHITNLRRKMGAYAGYIETVRGVGYRFRGDIKMPSSIPVL
ncbi:MAG: response regulator transcription factor [Desulfatitalea sp.]|nr:response regulator transcription factor [Desulfatitalea sp.]NNJ99708.1 response regulator transcription factor [Desulfatitalea sp.]